MGSNTQLTDTLTVGFGGALDRSHLNLVSLQGFGDVDGYDGAIYSAYQNRNLYLGGTLLSGLGFCDVTRHISLFSNYRSAKAEYRTFDLIGAAKGSLFF